MKLKYALIMMMVLVDAGCKKEKKVYTSVMDYPVPAEEINEMSYSPAKTDFHLWSPEADEVRVLLYESGDSGSALRSIDMVPGKDGVWNAEYIGDLMGKFYTFNVKKNKRWMGDTPGIFAKAVGVNGKRGAIIDWEKTDPEGWNVDRRPTLNDYGDIIVYEMHHRDFSIDTISGIRNNGKYIALTEEGTKTMQGETSGLDHLKELGVTHVHLLPSTDYASVDETHLSKKQYNWGYDPVNYNVPDGSYSTDPFKPEVRILEFKRMVQALHNAGIRVVLDVVYNHTYDIKGSAFERTAPGYFYRKTKDGKYSDASGCGNETASERPMMRKFMIQSVCYWAKEYHIDGFRFDLMGIHDIDTMNEIRKALDDIDPSIFIYGEGWAAGTPSYPENKLAMKKNMGEMPRISAFGDEMRDGLRGPWNDDKMGAFLIGKPGNEESVKFGLTGAIQHPQINYDMVNYSKSAWATQPTQMISYVSCHDDMCLADRLQTTDPVASEGELVALHKLAETVVFMSQGIPFIFNGDEIMRNKKGVHNSYNSPDSINAIDWNLKSVHKDVFDYVKGLIALRKTHSAFHLNDAEKVRRQMEFMDVDGSNVIAFKLKDHAGGDEWNTIYVFLNSRKEPATIQVPDGKYTVVCKDGRIEPMGLSILWGSAVSIPSQSALIMHD